MTMTRIAKLFFCSVLLIVAFGCSDDGTDEGSETTDGTETVDAGGPDDGGTDDASGEAPGEGDFELGDASLSIRSAGLEAGLGATAELVDETTVRLTMDSGTVATDYITACAVAGVILEDGETAIVVYPDGEHTC
jgi:hypothetical protein